jgi:hypothetical protein
MEFELQRQKKSRPERDSCRKRGDKSRILAMKTRVLNQTKRLSNKKLQIDC